MAPKRFSKALNFSKNALSSYWAEADVTTLIKEFGGSRQTVSHFANIPISSVRGARTPNLQINGNITFRAYAESNITYDHSWPSLSNSRLYPYTLDYLSIQECPVGICPTESFPGSWVLPINAFKSMSGIECNSLMGCAAK